MFVNPWKIGCSYTGINFIFNNCIILNNIQAVLAQQINVC